MNRTPFARRHAADDVSPVLNHLLRMEGTFFAGNALHNQARVLVDKNTHLFVTES